LEARLRKTGGTAYHCVNVGTVVDEGLSLSASAINGLRRDALSALTAARTEAPQRRELTPPALPDVDCSAETPSFTVSVTTAAQLSPALLATRPARVYVPLELLAPLAALPQADTEWCAILPRVWRDRDEAQLQQWLDHAKALGVTGALLGNIGHLPLVRESGLHLYGDYGLNVFNGRSLDYLRGKGLSSACLSFELRFAQMRDLPKVLPAEAIVYGRLPLMITENCLIENSGGCRCDRPNFLQDRTGAAFPLLPSYGHRTEIQNSKRLWLADRPEWRQLGLAFARLRFTTESPEECVRVVNGYQECRAPDGEFTRGLYERGVE
jgi:putative protease